MLVSSYEITNPYPCSVLIGLPGKSSLILGKI